VQGFKTCADVAKAEAEGEIVVYATNPEAAELRVLGEFAKLFPKIKPNYTRLQAGALYAKVTAERQAKTYTVDAMQISDMGMILDFQKKNGYVRYVSPQMAAHKEEYKSRPEGYWTWGAIGPAGTRLQPQSRPRDQAPKTWEEAIGPKWTDGKAVHLGPAARFLVRAAGCLRSGLLEEVRRAEAERV
jgi:iron(III) transport system substrate-binding protein